MTDTNIVGPHGPGINETTTRPADTASGSGIDTWFKPCTDNRPETGTKIPAQWLNKVTAFFRDAIRGVIPADPQLELDDELLLKCFLRVDKRVDNIDTDGVEIFAGMDVTGLVHLLRRVVGVNGITVQLSSGEDKIEIDGSGLGGVEFPGNWKLPCRIATTGNITDLAAGAPNIHDGVTLTTNDRVLVRAQTTTTQNGIYRVAVPGSGSNGQWVRSTDFDSSADAIPGSVVVVNEGTAHADSMWQLFTNAPITLGSTGLAWSKVLPVVHAVFGPSGLSHSTGHVPDPGEDAGTARFLCEDAQWRVPQITSSPNIGSFVFGMAGVGLGAETTPSVGDTFTATVGNPIKCYKGENVFPDHITAGTWRSCGGAGINLGAQNGGDYSHAVAALWQRIA